MKSILILLIHIAGIFAYSQSLSDDSLRSVKIIGNEKAVEETVEFYKRDNLDSLEYYSKLKLAADSKQTTEIYLDLVEGYLNFNEYEKAQLLLDSLFIDENSDKSIYVRSLISKGKLLNFKKKNEVALDVFYEALKFTTSKELDFLKPEIYFEIASILRENNDLAGCTKFYRFASEKAKDNGDIDLHVRSNIQMCKVYNGWVTVNLDSSVYYGELALRISQDAGYELGYASALSIAAAPIIRNGDVQRGLEMSKEALKYSDKFNFPLKDVYYLFLNQGFAFETLGKYDSAIFYMEKASKLRPQSIDHYRLKYIILKSQKSFQTALLAHEQYTAKVDSTLRRRNQSNLSLAQARFETDLKEKEVTSLSQRAFIQALRIEQKNQAIIIGIVVILLVMVAIYFIYKQQDLKKQQTQTELEQRFLRSQLNPHFISNALVAVQSFMLKNDSASAALYLTKFSKLMREILENSRKEFIPVEEEVNMLRNYLDIQKLRLGTFNFSIEVDENIDFELDIIPPMFVQPFLENAVEHGVFNDSKGGLIDLKFKKDGDYIAIEVKDNGGGLISNKNSDRNSLSSTIIKERMELFNRSLKRKIRLVIQNLKNEEGEVNGTIVELKVPFS
ncbi:MAG: tetratricopeptide (TPR) repeat protein [Cyclobacteriaceae bacterium]|jgi:tetratricopeptide (TPR) repeat protein